MTEQALAGAFSREFAAQDFDVEFTPARMTGSVDVAVAMKGAHS